ncbi:hypothetical protein [Kocuria tytonis]|uniref:Uncharacterized protein n=1 Tax=Kocuria tytonis TaxID=2054280 RepID=A0A495A5B2_9MICC|nr:hypothetical protein [Kocuria tytonis]RKQ34870.1 hypothetical protein C1C97_006150 [Kocuria tytonis]
MNPVQHPRGEHDSSDHHSQDTPRGDRAPEGHAPGGSRSDTPPRYGIRTGSAAPGDAARSGAPTTSPAEPPRDGHRPGPAGTDARSPEARTAATRAARRMGRGLSFTVVMMGFLVGLALVAMDLPVGWVIGAALVLLGVLGFATVQTRALPVFQDPEEPQRRPWSKLWLIPAALLLLGLGCLGTAFVVPAWLGPSVPADLLDDYVLAFIVGGMTMVVGAGLGFGLVATSRFTRPDDDDSPLRPTDYAERVGRRERRDAEGYYDSDWIRRDPRD